MSILSTSAKLVKVGQDYSAGNGISIDNYVISVTSSLTGEYATQSAFDELNDSFSTLSSNLNSNSGIWVDVASTYQTNSSTYLTAHQSLNGYATEQWVEDKGYITGVDLTPYQEKSGMVDYQTTAGMTAYATTSDVANKLDTTAFSNVSGTFLTAHQTIPSAKWETASDVVQSNSAQWSENTGDEEVNNAVYNNSAKWNEISVYESNSSTYLTAHQSLDGYATQDWVTEQGYITGVDLSDYAKTSAVHNDIDCAISGKLDTTAFSTVSGDFLTAHQDISYKLDTTAFSDVSGTFLTAVPADMATTGDVSDLAQTISETYQIKGDYLTTADSYNFYPANNPSGFITGVDLSNYYTKNETSGADELANAFANIPAGDAEVNAYVQSNSSTIDDVNTSYQTNSGTFLTAINIPESANWENTTDVVQTNSASWGQGGSTTTYDYTDNGLISAIDTSGLYAQSAASASHLNRNGTMDENIVQTYNGNMFYYMPLISPFGKPQGIFSPLQYATGACLAMSGGSFGAYYKGNEWYVCNPNIGQMLRGEVHQSRGVHLSGATTAGYSFDLSIHAVSGKNDTANGYNWKLERGCVSGKCSVGEWRYGPAEDTLLRSVSSNEVNTYVQNNSATIDDVNTTYQNASGTYLTAHQSLSDYATTSELNSISSYLSGAIDYVSANVGDEFPASANEAITAYQTNSASYLTAHQDISNKVDLSAYNELKSSYVALSSLFATYSGQWLLPNTGV